MSKLTLRLCSNGYLTGSKVTLKSAISSDVTCVISHTALVGDEEILKGGNYVSEGRNPLLYIHQSLCVKVKSGIPGIRTHFVGYNPLQL